MVVASRDRPEMLAAALDAVMAVLGPDDEVVVVDSASRDERTMAAAARSGARAVRCEQPGLARARNAGVAATTAPLLAFTDDDCQPRTGWIDAIRAAFDDPAVGFVAGRVVAAGSTASFAVSVTDATSRRRFGPDDDAAEVGHGANFAARRAALDDIGGFDELLGAGGPFRAAEDYDFFHRAMRAGWSGCFEPASVVAHRQWRSRRDAVRLQYGYGLGAGAFGAKATKVDRADGLAVLRGQLWGHGIVPLGRDLRNRYKTGVAMGVLRIAGTIVGAVRAVPLEVRDGRFVA